MEEHKGFRLRGLLSFVFETWMELLANVKTSGIHGITDDSVLVRKGRSCF